RSKPTRMLIGVLLPAAVTHGDKRSESIGLLGTLSSDINVLLRPDELSWTITLQGPMRRVFLHVASMACACVIATAMLASQAPAPQTAPPPQTPAPPGPGGAGGAGAPDAQGGGLDTRDLTR